jgi:hypothetical protein
MVGTLLRAALVIGLLVTPAAARQIAVRLHEEPFFKGGVQVQVLVDVIITRGECRQLIAAYRKRAKGGQVSVHRPVDSHSSGRAPWCVDNFDGRGVTFNETLFDWEVYRGGSRRQ